MAAESDKITDSAEESFSKTGDKYIWGIFIALCLISVIEAYSASSREVLSSGLYLPLVKHTILLVGGGLLVYFMQKVPYYKYIRFIPWFGLVTLMLLVYAQFFGKTMNGAQRAIYLPGFTLQPAEMAKLSAVLLIAWFTARFQKSKGVRKGGIISSAIVIALFGALLVMQGLTNTVLLMCISLSMLLIGGVEWKKFFALIGVYIIIGGILLGVSKLIMVEENVVADGSDETTEIVEAKNNQRMGTWQARIQRFLASDSLLYKEINSKNEQEMYARMAQANGGVIGVLPGNSRECSRLPLAFSDYIYSILVEELGYVGGLIVLVLYLWLFARAGSIASRCNRAFPALLVMGMAVMVVFQALFHICINVGVMPVSGQPLPLISKGGTSIIMTAIAFGLMLSVSRTAVQSNKSKEVKEEINELPEGMQGSNQTQIEK